jgi:hypothetical protein
LTVKIVFALSVAVIALPLRFTGNQVYDPAPVALSVSGPGAHIVGEAGLMLIVGRGFTTNIIVAEPIHPAALVPETVYTVVDEGVTVCVCCKTVPGCHVYVIALFADNTAGWPAQMLGLDDTGNNDGKGETLMFIAALAVHTPLEPKTVKVVLEAGNTVTVPPGILPGCQR